MAIVQAKTITQLMGEGYSVAWGTATLTDSVTLSVTTGIKNVTALHVTMSVRPTTTIGTALIGFIPTQNTANSGKVHLTHLGATDTTLVTWFAIAESAR